MPCYFSFFDLKHLEKWESTASFSTTSALDCARQDKPNSTMSWSYLGSFCAQERHIKPISGPLEVEGESAVLEGEIYILQAPPNY